MQLKNNLDILNSQFKIYYQYVQYGVSANHNIWDCCFFNLPKLSKNCPKKVNISQGL